MWLSLSLSLLVLLKVRRWHEINFNFFFFRSPIDHQQEADYCIQKFLEMGNICHPINFFQPGSDELFVGRAGYLCGSLILNKKLGRTVVSSEVTRPIFDAIIVSGQQYSQRHRSKSPLMYSYYRTEYLGKCWVQWGLYLLNFWQFSLLFLLLWLPVIQTILFCGTVHVHCKLVEQYGAPNFSKDFYNFRFL